uniref:ABC transporter transmembrane domain-containing protein n=3 Tax=Treponema pedis TaxID=409322 RepID=UPI0005701659
VAVPVIQSSLIDYISKGYFSAVKIFAVFALSVLSIILLSAASILPSLLMIKYETKEKLSLIFFTKFLSKSFLHNTGAAGLYYGFCSIANDLSFTAYPAILNIILSLIQSLVVLYFLFKISSAILYLTLIIWAVYAGVILILQKKYKIYVSMLRKLKPPLIEKLNMTISKVNTITRFGNKKKFIDDYIEQLKKYNKINKKADHFMQIQTMLLTYLQGICFALFILVSMPDIYSGSLTKGMLVMILSYIPLLMQPLSKIQYFFQIKKWILEGEANRSEFIAECSIHELSGNISFPNCEEKRLNVKNLCFSYKEFPDGN